MKIINLAAIIIATLFIVQATVEPDLSPEEKKLKEDIRKILDSHLVEGEKWGMKYHFYRPGL